MPTTAVRASDRFAGNESAVSILRDVLGFEGGDWGPKWLLDPTPAQIDDFWTANPDLPEGARVWVAPGLVATASLEDAGGRTLDWPDGPPLGHLFFVDPTPNLEWAHAAKLFMRDTEGRWHTLAVDFPPSKGLNLQRIRRG